MFEITLEQIVAEHEIKERIQYLKDYVEEMTADPSLDLEAEENWVEKMSLVNACSLGFDYEQKILDFRNIILTEYFKAYNDSTNFNLNETINKAKQEILQPYSVNIVF